MTLISMGAKRVGRNISNFLNAKLPSNHHLRILRMFKYSVGISLVYVFFAWCRVKVRYPAVPVIFINFSVTGSMATFPDGSGYSRS